MGAAAGFGDPLPGNRGGPSEQEPGGSPAAEYLPLEKMPRLDEIPLDKTMEEAEYQEELDKLQKRLGELHNRLYRKRVPLIIAYEGWDAAGKRGKYQEDYRSAGSQGF
mgnify:CR=1 FL=1